MNMSNFHGYYPWGALFKVNLVQLAVTLFWRYHRRSSDVMIGDMYKLHVFYCVLAVFNGI